MNNELPTTNCGKLPFNLSNRAEERIISGVSYREKDVKKFIRLLKEELNNKRGTWKRGTIKLMIDKLAGEKFK